MSTQWYNALQTKNNASDQTGSLGSASSQQKSSTLSWRFQQMCSGRQGASLRKQKQDSLQADLWYMLNTLLEPGAVLFAMGPAEKRRSPQRPEAQLPRHMPDPAPGRDLALSGVLGPSQVV